MSVIYFMRAYKTTPTTGYVKWQSPNVPDPTASLSGYNFNELSGIIVTTVSYTNVGVANPPLNFSIDGYLSLIDTLPSIFDSPYVVENNATISNVRLVRRTAGTSGTTRINILLNGISIFSSDGNKPQISSTDGNNATSLKNVFSTSSIAAGQRLEAQIETIEGGNPADIRVTITLA